MAKKGTVIAELRNPLNYNDTEIDPSKLDADVISTVFRAYGSMRKPYQNLTTMAEVAKYFQTSESTIKAVLNYGLATFGVTSFDKAWSVIRQAAGNQGRGAVQKGLSSSENKNYKLLGDREKDFVERFTEYLFSKFIPFTKTYLNGTATMIETARNFGLAVFEAKFVLVAMASTWMSKNELDIFVPRYMRDFYDYYGSVCSDDCESISRFRQRDDIRRLRTELEGCRHNSSPEAISHTQELMYQLYLAFLEEYFDVVFDEENPED